MQWCTEQYRGLGGLGASRAGGVHLAGVAGVQDGVAGDLAQVGGRQLPHLGSHAVLLHQGLPRQVDLRMLLILTCLSDEVCMCKGEWTVGEIRVRIPQEQPDSQSLTPASRQPLPTLESL